MRLHEIILLAHKFNKSVRSVINDYCKLVEAGYNDDVYALLEDIYEEKQNG